LKVEAPGRQDADAQEYQASFELTERSQTGWIDVLLGHVTAILILEFFPLSLKPNLDEPELTIEYFWKKMPLRGNLRAETEMATA
jgi:hypothetical protein